MSWSKSGVDRAELGSRGPSDVLEEDTLGVSIFVVDNKSRALLARTRRLLFTALVGLTNWVLGLNAASSDNIMVILASAFKLDERTFLLRKLPLLGW